MLDSSHGTRPLHPMYEPQARQLGQSDGRSGHRNSQPAGKLLARGFLPAGQPLQGLRQVRRQMPEHAPGLPNRRDEREPTLPQLELQILKKSIRWGIDEKVSTGQGSRGELCHRLGQSLVGEGTAEHLESFEIDDEDAPFGQTPQNAKKVLACLFSLHAGSDPTTVA